MQRPKCRRCGGPLDVEYEPAEGDAPGYYFWGCCNVTRKGVHAPIRTDAETELLIEQLGGDDVARLDRQAVELADGVSRA